MVTEWKWEIPPGTAGRQQQVRVGEADVNDDGTSSQAGHTIEWFIQ
jgi:hypothetical protein